MSTIEHEFIRRYATSPIHVPRLERLLAAYAPPAAVDGFAELYLTWDRECGDPEAGRIVTEALVMAVDSRGAILPIRPEVVRTAIAWVAAASGFDKAERAECLKVLFSELAAFPA